MNNKFLLSAALVASSFTTMAQSNKAYAITGDGNNDYIWMNIREINLSSGQVTKTIFERGKTNFKLTKF